jgi:hypothetical protein
MRIAVSQLALNPTGRPPRPNPRRVAVTSVSHPGLFSSCRLGLSAAVATQPQTDHIQTRRHAFQKWTWSDVRHQLRRNWERRRVQMACCTHANRNGHLHCLVSFGKQNGRSKRIYTCTPNVTKLCATSFILKTGVTLIQQVQQNTRIHTGDLHNLDSLSNAVLLM